MTNLDHRQPKTAAENAVDKVREMLRASPASEITVYEISPILISLLTKQQKDEQRMGSNRLADKYYGIQFEYLVYDGPHAHYFGADGRCLEGTDRHFPRNHPHTQNPRRKFSGQQFLRAL